MRTAAIAAALALSATSGALQAQALSGLAEAIDGDSLSVGGMQVRLFGIDAPEGRQTCNRDGREWPCGEVAAGKLRSMIEGQTVACRGRGTDAYGRTVAICQAGSIELNRAMVAYGWATAFREFSQDYVADESRAKAARLGIWDSSFILPGDYRQQQVGTIQASPQRQTKRVAQAPSVMGRCAMHWLRD